MNVPPGAKVPLVLVGASDAIRGWADQHQETISRLARLGSIAFEDAPPAGAAVIAFGETTAALPLAGIIDMDAEKARLRREIDKAAADIAKIDAVGTPVVAKVEEVVESSERKDRSAFARLATLKRPKAGESKR